MLEEFHNSRRNPDNLISSGNNQTNQSKFQIKQESPQKTDKVMTTNKNKLTSDNDEEKSEDNKVQYFKQLAFDYIKEKELDR